MASKLTVIIPCKNERENIRACVASAQLVADEVLVADSGSTDGTFEIAQALGCRIIAREYRTSGDFKNWAIPHATNEWVFILDADERITTELANEIRDRLIDPQRDGYWVYRLNHFVGHPILHGPWRNDRCLRLFRRDVGRYVGPTDHAEVEIGSGSVGKLRERLVHYTCTSYSQYLPKLSRYADVQARVWKEAGRRPSFGQLLFRFPSRFLQGYVLRLGFLDGLAGLQVCGLVAYLSWLKQAYLWQMECARAIAELDRNSVSLVASGSADSSDASRNDAAGLTPGGAGGCRTNGLEIEDGDRLQSTGGASGTREEVQACATREEIEARAKRTFKEWRHRVTPSWLRTDVRRQRRNILVRKLGYQRCFTPPILIRDPSLFVRSSLRYVVAHEMAINPRMTFLQIGAFDGVGEDDLRELVAAHNLRGVLVEPQPAAFARLQHTYRNQPQVALLQAAIAETEGPRDLFCHRSHASMAASFDRNHLKKHGISDHDIVAQPVPCHTVASALGMAGLDDVDMIQIDAEGYDWPIMRSIDFTRIRPRVLRFEYRHMSDADADECIAHLASHGYRFILESHDIIAVRIDSAGTSVRPQRRSA